MNSPGFLPKPPSFPKPSSSPSTASPLATAGAPSLFPPFTPSAPAADSSSRAVASSRARSHSFIGDVDEAAFASSSVFPSLPLAASIPPPPAGSGAPALAAARARLRSRSFVGDTDGTALASSSVFPNPSLPAASAPPPPAGAGVVPSALDNLAAARAGSSPQGFVGGMPLGGHPQPRGLAGAARWLSQLDILAFGRPPVEIVAEQVKQQSLWGFFLTLVLPIAIASFFYFFVSVEMGRPPLSTTTIADLSDFSQRLEVTVNPLANGAPFADGGILLPYFPANLDAGQACLVKNTNLIQLGPNSTRILRTRLYTPAANEAITVNLAGCPSNLFPAAGGTSVPSGGMGLLFFLNADCATTRAHPAAPNTSWPLGVPLQEVLGDAANGLMLQVALKSFLGAPVAGPLTSLAIPLDALNVQMCQGFRAFTPRSGALGEDTASGVDFDGSSVPAAAIQFSITQVRKMDEPVVTNFTLRSIESTPTFEQKMGTPIDLSSDKDTCITGRRITFSCSAYNGSCDNAQFFNSGYFMRLSNVSAVRGACTRACAVAWSALKGAKQNLTQAVGAMPLSFTEAPFVTDLSGAPAAPPARAAKRGDGAPAAAARAAPALLAWTVAGLYGEGLATHSRARWDSFARFLQARGTGGASGACGFAASIVQQVGEFDGCSTTSMDAHKLPLSRGLCYQGPFDDLVLMNYEAEVLATQPCSSREASEPAFERSPLRTETLQAMGCRMSFRQLPPANFTCGITVGMPAPLYHVESVGTQAPLFVSTNLSAARGFVAAASTAVSLCAHASYALLLPQSQLEIAWLAAEALRNASVFRDAASAMASVTLEDVANCVPPPAAGDPPLYSSPTFIVAVWLNTEEEALMCFDESANGTLTKARASITGNEAPDARPILPSGGVSLATSVDPTGHVLSTTTFQSGWSHMRECEAIRSQRPLAGIECADLTTPRFNGWVTEGSSRPALLLLLRVFNEAVVEVETRLPLNWL